MEYRAALPPLGGKGISNPSDAAQGRGMLRAPAKVILTLKTAYADHKREKCPGGAFFKKGLFRPSEATWSSEKITGGLPPARAKSCKLAYADVFRTCIMPQASHGKTFLDAAELPPASKLLRLAETGSFTEVPILLQPRECLDISQVT